MLHLAKRGQDNWLIVDIKMLHVFTFLFLWRGLLQISFCSEWKKLITPDASGRLSTLAISLIFSP